MFHVPNEYRKRIHLNFPELNSTDEDGNNGFFYIPFKSKKSQQKLMFVVGVSNHWGWEHVSVSVKLRSLHETNRCPTWEEMCIIKDLFWDKTDCVIQYHPADSEYVNLHNYILHLWRQINVEFPIPDKILV